MHQLGEHPETRDAIRISVAFAARALDDERIATVLTRGNEEVEALATAVVAQAQADGLTGPGDPEEEGRVLLGLATGLGCQVALYGVPPAVARATLHHHLDRVAPPGPRGGARPGGVPEP